MHRLEEILEGRLDELLDGVRDFMNSQADAGAS